MRVIIAATLFIQLLGFSALSHTSEFVEGKDYQLLANASHQSTNSSIIVEEAFAYSCGHCYAFEETLHAWIKKQPKDVTVKKLHVAWADHMMRMVVVHTTGVLLNIEEELNKKIFYAIHKERRNVFQREELISLFSSLGIDSKTLQETFESPETAKLANEAAEKTKDYGIKSTPSMVVDGRYTVVITEDINRERMLDIVDYLVAKIRKEKQAEK